MTNSSSVNMPNTSRAAFRMRNWSTCTASVTSPHCKDRIISTQRCSSFSTKRFVEMRLVGVDLAWKPEKNGTAIAVGSLDGDGVNVEAIHRAVVGVSAVVEAILA